MTGTFLALAWVTIGAGRRGVDRVEHEHLRAVGQRGLGLLLLLGRVLVGVAVDDLAVGAQLLDLGLEERPVLGLVAGGLGLRQEQGDLPASRGGGTRGVAARGAVVVAAARAGAERDRAHVRAGRSPPRAFV